MTPKLADETKMNEWAQRVETMRISDMPDKLSARKKELSNSCVICSESGTFEVGFTQCFYELWPVIESMLTALDRLCLVGPPNMHSDGENISRGQLHDNCEIAEAALADAKERLGLE